jgi:hypothetical protein
MRRGLFVSLVLLASALPVGATDRYVDGTVSTHTHTYDVAKRVETGGSAIVYPTIQGSFSDIAAGDTVYIRAGTYALTTSISMSAKAGTLGSPIVIRNYLTESVTVDGSAISPSTSGYAWRITGCTYVTVQGLDFLNCKRKSLYLYDSDNCSVVNCDDSGALYTAFYVHYCDYATVDGCTTTNQSYPTIRSIGSNYLTIKNCVVDGSGAGYAGISVQGGDYVLIDRNEAVGGKPGIAVTHYDTTVDVMANFCVVSNNLVHDCLTPPEGADGIVVGTGTYDCAVLSNVVYDNEDDGIDVSCNQTAGMTSLRNFVIGNISFNSAPGHLGDGNGFKFSTNHGGGHRAIGNISFDNWISGINQDKEVGYPKNYFVHNTVYNNGWNTGNVQHCGIGLDEAGDPTDELPVIYNNVFSSNAGNDEWNKGATSVQESNYNLLGDGITTGGQDGDSLTGDPGYQGVANDPDTTFAEGLTIDQKLAQVRDSVLGKLGLATGSQCINAGKWLTTITSATGKGTSFVVADPNYFWPGNANVSTPVAGSVIKTSAGQIATVTAVVIATNTITVSPEISWTVGDGVGYMYYGSAPDMGAYEYNPAGAPPGPPTTPSPLNHAVGQAINVTLSWAAVADATSYDVYYDVFSPPTTLRSDGQVGLSYATSGLSYLTTIYWKVVAINDYGDSSGSSGIWDFVTLAEPMATPTYLILRVVP